MPEITNLLGQSYITYYHVKRIIELLKVSEKDTKSFFGSYSSQRMKDWLQIVEKYEADNVFIAESTRIIQHNVSYEVPALKKKIENCQNKLADSERKESQLKAAAETLKVKFKQTCRDIGIEGTNIAGEMKNVANTLPEILDGVVTSVKAADFLKAIDYYKAFLGFTLDDHNEAETVKLLQFVAAEGNSSVYKFETGLDLPAGGGADSSGGGAAAADSGGIDFGDDSGGIDFGDSGDAGGIDFGDDGGGIDFGDGSGDAGGISGITIEGSGSGGAPPVKTRDAVLQYSQTRNVMVDQILELEGFLQQRIEELSTDTFDITSINQFDGADSAVVPPLKAVKSMLAAVEKASSVLTSAKTAQVVMVASSSKFVGRLVKSLEQKRSGSDAMLGKIKDLEVSRIKWRETITETQPKLSGLIDQTKQLQGQVEGSVSALYKGRKVNLQGDINTM